MLIRGIENVLMRILIQLDFRVRRIRYKEFDIMNRYRNFILNPNFMKSHSSVMCISAAQQFWKSTYHSNHITWFCVQYFKFDIVLGWTTSNSANPGPLFKWCTRTSYDYNYRKISNIRRTLVCHKLLMTRPGVVGASPVGAAPTTSSFST